MKKSLLALAVLGAAAFSAQAANVSLYGVVDAGLAFTNTDEYDIDGKHVVSDESNFSMDSGINAASRFGIIGTEDLGNGMKVSFKLENGFNPDDGTMNQENRLFGREASLTLSGDFGKISAGRMGGVGSSAGTYDYVFAMAEAFDGGDYEIWGMASSSRYDNMITYETPSFAGVKFTAQYSFDADTKSDNDDYKAGSQHGDEGKTTVDRYASFAVTGEYGALQFVGAYEYFNHASNSLVQEDGHLVHVGGNYDFGVTKVFALAQYFQGLKGVNNAWSSSDLVDDDMFGTERFDGFKGYGLHLGAITPLFGGDLTTAVYWNDFTMEAYQEAATDRAEDFDGSYIGVSARYAYHLSKRTDLYVGAGYAKADFETGTDGVHDAEKKLAQAYVGMTHRF